MTPPTLPPELVAIIFSHLPFPSYTDLASCCLASFAFLELASPILYGKVVIKRDEDLGKLFCERDQETTLHHLHPYLSLHRITTLHIQIRPSFPPSPSRLLLPSSSSSSSPSSIDESSSVDIKASSTSPSSTSISDPLTTSAESCFPSAFPSRSTAPDPSSGLAMVPISLNVLHLSLSFHGLQSPAYFPTSSSSSSSSTGSISSSTMLNPTSPSLSSPATTYSALLSLLLPQTLLLSPSYAHSTRFHYPCERASWNVVSSRTFRSRLRHVILRGCDLAAIDDPRMGGGGGMAGFGGVGGSAAGRTGGNGRFAEGPFVFFPPPAAEQPPLLSDPADEEEEEPSPYLTSFAIPLPPHASALPLRLASSPSTSDKVWISPEQEPPYPPLSLTYDLTSLPPLTIPFYTSFLPILDFNSVFLVPSLTLPPPDSGDDSLPDFLTLSLSSDPAPSSRSQPPFELDKDSQVGGVQIVVSREREEEWIRRGLQGLRDERSRAFVRIRTGTREGSAGFAGEMEKPVVVKAAGGRAGR